MSDRRRSLARPTRHRWLLGFLGMLSVLGLAALDRGNTLGYFWLAFAGFFGYFGERWPRLRHLWVLGPIGFAVAMAGVAGLLPGAS